MPYADPAKNRENKRLYARRKAASAAGLAKLRAAAAKHRASPQGRAAGKARRNSPRGKYVHQRWAARSRGIEFLFTFDEWWKLWEPYWDRRGACRNCLVMARNGDCGPYALGNVRIITNRENVLEMSTNIKC